MVYQGKQEASNRCLAGVGGVGDFSGLLGVAKKGEGRWWDSEKRKENDAGMCVKSSQLGYKYVRGWVAGWGPHDLLLFLGRIGGW